MRTIVETDATTVRVKQHSTRNKKKLIGALFISIILICSILVLFGYFYKHNGYNSKEARQENHTLLEKSIHSVANNNNDKHQGIVNYEQKGSPKICSKTTWFKAAITVVGGNGVGSALNQLAQPNDMFVDDQDAIYIADSFNHRIVKWDEGARQGRVVAGGNGKGNQANQLNYPTAVFVDRLKNTYVADNGNNRIRKWSINSKNGETIIGQFGRGSRLDQIDNCWGIYVDRDYSVYVSELSNNRITKWSLGAQFGQIVVETYAPRGIYVHEKTGDIYVASAAENSIKQFAADGSLIRDVGKGLVKSPHGVITIAGALSKDIYVFIADSEHHRILQMQISNHNNMKIIAGTNNISGNQSNELDKPIKVQFDSHGNLLVLDFNNQRVQNFSLENKNCDIAHSILHLSKYSTRSPYVRVRPNLNIIPQSQDQKTSDEASPSKDKDSPINDNFFPEPSFGESQRSVDTDVRRPSNDFSVDLPNVPSFGGSSFRIGGRRRG